MITIKKAIEEIIASDIETENALSRNILNLSKYANEIHAKVEDLTMKKVSTSSIIVTLSRLSKKRKMYGPLKQIPLINLSIKGSVVEYIYPKNEGTMQALFNLIQKSQREIGSFISFSTSTRHIALIISTSLQSVVTESFKESPITIKTNLVAISTQFHPDLVEEYGIGYSILHRVARARIILDEVVSTFDEFTLVCHEKYLAPLIQTLKQ